MAGVICNRTGKTKSIAVSTLRTTVGQLHQGRMTIVDLRGECGRILPLQLVCRRQTSSLEFRNGSRMKNKRVLRLGETENECEIRVLTKENPSRT